MDEGTGGIDDIDLARLNLLLDLGGDAVRADGYRLAFDVFDAIGYLNADARQPLQDLLVVHHRP